MIFFKCLELFSSTIHLAEINPVSSSYQMVKSRCSDPNVLSSHWSSPALLTYIHKCCSITWQMALQRPAMTLDDSRGTFDDVRHRLWWSCDQAKAKDIDYVIWPSLYDYDGGNLMVKGCVHAS